MLLMSSFAHENSNFLTLCSGISTGKVSPKARAVNEVQHLAVFGMLYPPGKIDKIFGIKQ